MKKLSIEEKIKIIEESSNLDDIALSALPNVYGDSYYFVSYSHKDYKKVYIDILKLQEAGINIWYDRGLVPGKSWQDYADEAIAKHNCIGVIFYLSENTLLSQAIAHEIEYVKKIGKDFLSINLPIENDPNNYGKITSAKNMLLLEQIKNSISSLSLEIISNTFTDEVIYLKYTDSTESKVDKIKALEKPNLINYLLSNDNTAKVLSTNSIDMRNIVIPDNTIIDNESIEVTGIEECAFANCKYLESITLPTNCVEIKDRSFFGCTNLKEIVLSNKICKIGKYSFGDCTNLEKVAFSSDTIETIDTGAFSNCKSIKEIIIPSAIKNIENGVFEGNELEKITISNEFSKRHTLSNYSSEDDFLIRSIEKEEYKTKRTILNAIRHNRFYKKILIAGKSVGDINITARVDEIAPLAYKDCHKLKSITIPSRIKIIDNQSFMNCSKLEELKFDKPFHYEKGLVNKFLGFKKELIIKDESFANCFSLKEIMFPQYIQSIGFKTFYNCINLKKVEFLGENSIYNILDGAFENCKSLEEIIIPSSVKRIGDCAFKNCINLKKVIFEDKSQLTYLGDSAFEGCINLTTINLPNSLSDLKSDLFKGCDSLKEITIPSSIITLKNSFTNCKSLEKIIFPSNTKIKNIYSMILVDCPNTIIEYNKKIKNWKKINQSNLLATLGTKSKSIASIIRKQYRSKKPYPNKPGVLHSKTLCIEYRNLVKCKDGIAKIDNN